jgi:hypothetical protein
MAAYACTDVANEPDIGRPKGPDQLHGLRSALPSIYDCHFNYVDQSFKSDDPLDARSAGTVLGV